MSQVRYPPIAEGFIEGIAAPFLELLGFAAFLTSYEAAKALNQSTIPAWELLLGLLAFDFMRNVIIGLSTSNFALGNFFGNLFSLYISHGAISSISNEAAIDSLLFLVALLVSLALGIILSIRNWNQPSESYYSDGFDSCARVMGCGSAQALWSQVPTLDSFCPLPGREALSFVWERRASLPSASFSHRRRLLFPRHRGEVRN